MARIKQTIMQRSFQFMELHPDFLEADNLELRQMSLRKAQNLRCLPSRTIAAREGTFYLRTMADARQMKEFRIGAGLRFILVVGDDYLSVLDGNGGEVYHNAAVPWSDGSVIWAEDFRERVLIGGEFGIRSLTYENGTFALSAFAFEGATGGEISQPYWVFNKGVTIQPSARTGIITIEASDGVFSSGYVGLRIRYGFREIQITEFISSTTLRGTVISRLPPSFQITVEDASEFLAGEAVVGADTNFQGVVVSIDGNDLLVASQEIFDGPDVDEMLNGASASSKVTAAVEVQPLPSTVWDEPLMSDLRGWPRAAASAAGRLVLLDFPSTQDVIAASSSRDVTDFKVGSRDDDAIVRQCGDNSPRWLHAVNIGDVVVLADNGVYIIPTRESGVISPSDFSVVPVDSTGCSTVRPAKVEDGVVFVDAAGKGVSAALLDGNIYKKWSVRSVATYHRHLIKDPVSLCGPSLTSGRAEKYLFVVNADGTMAAVTWQDSIRDEQIGFAPWVTRGSYKAMAPVFDGYWALVDRSIDGTTVRMLERFTDEAYLDCAIQTSGYTTELDVQIEDFIVEIEDNVVAIGDQAAAHLAGEVASVYAGGWDCGDHLVAADGLLPTEPVISGSRQIGLNFESIAEPWPIEIIQSPRVGSLRARTLQCIVSVKDTLGFFGTMNTVTREIGAYDMGADLALPPPPKTKVFKFAVFGNRDHPLMRLEKRRPGPFHVLAIGQRVQG
jgi:hypothetical protein